MKNNKISNPKTEVPKGISLNDQDYMTILLTLLKAIEKNMTVALTESSNETLYKEFKKMFDDIAKIQRDAYELMFRNGWYSLEKAETKKVSTLEQELNTQMESLES